MFTTCLRHVYDSLCDKRIGAVVRKCDLTPLPAYRNGMLFDNPLNDKRFRIDIRSENGYEEGCKRGAK